MTILRQHGFTMVVLLVLSLVTGSLVTGAEHWPQFRGPHGNGHADSIGLPSTWSQHNNVVWRTAIHDRGWSSPVVWNN